MKITARCLTQFLILGLVTIFLSACTNGCSEKVDVNDTTLRYPIKANIKGLDPIHSNSVYSSRVISQIFTPLYEYHYLKRPYELKPLLAESMPKASKDGLTHTIKIKKGVKFHNNDCFENGIGREVKATDAIYSWKRLADPKLKANGFWVFDGKIKGLNKWRDANMDSAVTDYEAEIEGLQAVDDYTIKITLTRPYYQLYYVLAMEFTSIVPREAVEQYGEEFLNNPVGTGPYVFTEWIRGSKITLDRNPTWMGQKYPTEGTESDKKNGLLADAGKPIPFNDRIVFEEVVEDQPRWLKFLKGKFDISGIPKDNFDSTVSTGSLTPEMKEKGIQLQTSLAPDVTYIAFNMKDPILGENEALRKAISMAYDTSTSIEKFYNGRAVQAHSPIAPTVDAYDPDFKNPYVDYNPEKAKKMLADAGFPEGKGLPELEYTALATSTSRQMAEFLKQSLEVIGLKIKIVSVTWPQLQSRIKDAKAQMWGIAWLADYPDAENFLQLLYGPNKAPGPNASNFDNKKFNKLYKKAALMPPSPERTAVYHEMRDIFVEKMPWVPNVHRKDYWLYHGWVKNFKFHSMKSNFLKYLRIDPQQRAELREKI